MERKEIEQRARDAGPWTDEAAEAIKFLRELSARQQLTEHEQNALRILRQREVLECIRIRNA